MREDRAVSTTVSYVLTLAIATVLVAGLVGAGGAAVDQQREQTIRQELGVVGAQISNGLSMADRLVRGSATDPSAVSITRQLPSKVVGTGYTVELVDPGGSPPYLVLTASGSDVSVRVEVSTETPVEPTTISGGAVQIEYDTGLSPSRLVIRHD
jgi:hypothetical protein